MSETTSVGEASDIAPGGTDYAGDWPGSTEPRKVESGPFVLKVCSCEFPVCGNVPHKYCRYQGMWLGV